MNAPRPPVCPAEVFLGDPAFHGLDHVVAGPGGTGGCLVVTAVGEPLAVSDLTFEAWIRPAAESAAEAGSGPQTLLSLALENHRLSLRLLPRGGWELGQLRTWASDGRAQVDAVLVFQGDDTGTPSRWYYRVDVTGDFPYLVQGWRRYVMSLARRQMASSRFPVLGDRKPGLSRGFPFNHRNRGSKMKLPHTTADQSIGLESSSLRSYSTARCGRSASENAAGNQPGTSIQGCSAYSKTDSRKIGNADQVRCVTLGGQRAISCTEDHDAVNAHCGTINCGEQALCLDARIKTMGHFNSASKDLDKCIKGIWERDDESKRLAKKAISNLQKGEAGHQTAINLVRNWIDNNCQRVGRMPAGRSATAHATVKAEPLSRSALPRMLTMAGHNPLGASDSR